MPCILIHFKISKYLCFIQIGVNCLRDLGCGGSSYPSLPRTSMALVSGRLQCMQLDSCFKTQILRWINTSSVQHLSPLQRASFFSLGTGKNIRKMHLPAQFLQVFIVRLQTKLLDCFGVKSCSLPMLLQ